MISATRMEFCDSTNRIFTVPRETSRMTDHSLHPAPRPAGIPIAQAAIQRLGWEVVALGVDRERKRADGDLIVQRFDHQLLAQAVPLKRRVNGQSNQMTLPAV